MGNRRLSVLMAILTAAFFLRVAGQAVQRWLPQAWLPPFGDWQGSSTPYPLLIAIQLVILGAMIATSIRVASGELVRRPLAARGWWWAGGIYMAASIARIGVGLVVPEAPRWFSATISEAFHLVLAGFVLAVGAYHSARSAR